MQTQTKKLDLVGQVCPWPVIFTVKELKKLENGEVLEVLVEHLPSTINIPSAVKKDGHEILSSKAIFSETENVFEKNCFLIRFEIYLNLSQISKSISICTPPITRSIILISFVS